MKPLHLNLASRPYRDYKPVYAVIVVASLLIAFLMLNNIETYYRYVRDTRNTRAEIDALNKETAREHELAAAAEQQLRSADLKALDSEAKFINARLAERAFSWSDLLERLESILPANVRIHNITPSFDKSGLVHLELNCEGRTAETMLDTIRALQLNPHFMNPFPHSQTATDKGFYSFTIGVDFKPPVARMASR